MAPPEGFEDVCQSFIKSTGGKGNVINNKCMKKIFDDGGLKACGVTSTDLDINFSKAMAKCPGAKAKGGLAPAEMYQYVLCDDLGKKAAKKLKCSDEEGGDKLADKIKECGGPKGHGTTKTSKTGGVEKMTDTSQYTGAHKERFGADGKGKGIEGREDRAENTGYVGQYKGEGTYDKK